MTTQVLSLPIFRAFDSAGLPLAGGLLYTYAAGTTTPLATYSSSDTSTPNANPVVLDSSGTAVVRTTTAAYKFVLKDATGTNTLWSVDNWQGNYLSASDIGTLLYPQTAGEISAAVTPSSYVYAPYNVLRYGADPTGVSSSLTAFTNAYNAAMAASPHGAIYIPAGTYLIPSPGLSWTNQHDIRMYGDGPNLSVLTYSGSNYTVLTISADTGGGTTGTNLHLANFGIAAMSGATGVGALSLADYLFFKLENLQLYSSAKALKLAGMASGVCDNIVCQTAGTNAAGDCALNLAVDTASVGTGPVVFNGGSFNGQSNVTVGGAVWSRNAFCIVFNGSLFTAFGPSLTSVIELTNNDDITFIEPYSESGRNTTADTAVWINAGATAAPQNLTIIGGTIFSGAGGHYLNYGVNMVATQALKIENTAFSGFKTAAIKYASLTQASMVTIENVYSSGTGSPPVLDSSIVGPTSAYLKSWHDPWPRLDASLTTGVNNVTGDGTVYTVLFDTKNFDTGSNYSTGTGIFTVGSQSGGMYEVSTAVMVNGLSASWTNYELDIVQKNAGGSVITTHAVSINPGAVRNASNQASLAQNCLLKCAAGDQIYVTVAVSGSTKSIGVVGSSTEYSRMCIRYVG